MTWNSAWPPPITCTSATPGVAATSTVAAATVPTQAGTSH